MQRATWRCRSIRKGCIADSRAWARRRSRQFTADNEGIQPMHSSQSLPPKRVIQVNDLSVTFRAGARLVEAVNHLSFTVDRGETLAIVGESGSGKSVTALALMRLVEHGGGRIASGNIAFRRRNDQVLDLAGASNSIM